MIGSSSGAECCDPFSAPSLGAELLGNLAKLFALQNKIHTAVGLGGMQAVSC